MLVCSISLLVACAKPHEGSRGEVSAAHLWAMSDVRSKRITDDIYLRGSVVLNDKFGESPYAVVVADDSGCVEIELDSRDVERLLPLGSEVVVRCSGLWLGRQGRNVVLGAEPHAEYVVERVAESDIYNYIKVTSYTASCHPKPMTIGDITEARLREYVVLSDVWFMVDDGATTWCNEGAEGRYETTLRYLTDGKDVLPVVVAGTADYAHEPLPIGPQRCCGIVEWRDGVVMLRIAHRQTTAIK